MNLYILLLMFHNAQGAFLDLQNDRDVSYEEDIHRTTSAPSLISCTLHCKVIDVTALVRYYDNVCTCLKQSENVDENKKTVRGVFQPKILTPWSTLQVEQSKWNHVWILQNKTAITKGALMTNLPYMSKEYILSFDVKLTSPSIKKMNIIHMTTGKQNMAYGTSTPSIFVDKGDFLFRSAVNSKARFGHIYRTKVLYDKWLNLKVSQLATADYEIIYEIAVNDTVVHSVINKDPAMFRNLKCYVSNPLDDHHPGHVRNYWIKLKIK